MRIAYWDSLLASHIRNGNVGEVWLGGLRELSRGDIVRGTASFRCDDAACPVTVVRIGFSEQRSERFASGPGAPGANTSP
jgi:hypothetical protein